MKIVKNGVQHISLQWLNVIFRLCLLVKVEQGNLQLPILLGVLTAPKGTVTIDGLDLCDIDIGGGANKLLCISTSTYYERDLA